MLQSADMANWIRATREQPWSAKGYIRSGQNKTDSFQFYSVTVYISVDTNDFSNCASSKTVTMGGAIISGREGGGQIVQKPIFMSK